VVHACRLFLTDAGRVCSARHALDALRGRRAYTELTATPTVIEGPDRAKTVTSTIDKSVMNAHGASFLQMCFGAPYTFATRPGTTLTGVDTDGNGINDFFYGLLPDCGAPPCVSSRNKTNAGDGVIVTQAPGGTADPAYRP
jgi:hypothetical protein